MAFNLLPRRSLDCSGHGSDDEDEINQRREEDPEDLQQISI
jgi:hypothetical protein